MSLKPESGQTMAEYAVTLSLITILIVFTLGMLAGNISALIGGITALIDSIT